MSEKEIRKLIKKTLQENYQDDDDFGVYGDGFDELEFDTNAMHAAQLDIEDEGGEFEELGRSKFEKDPKFKEKFKSAVKQANLNLPSDDEEIERLANAIKQKKAHEKKFGAGSMNEEFEEGPQPGDAEYHTEKPEIANGISNFNDIDWMMVHGILVNNTKALKYKEPIEDITYSINNFQEVGFSKEDLELLENRDIIYIWSGMPIIDDDKYIDYNTFLNDAKIAWEKGFDDRNLNENSDTYDTTNLYKFLKDAMYSLESKDLDYAETAKKLESALTKHFNINRKDKSEFKFGLNESDNIPKDSKGNSISLKDRIKYKEFTGRVERFIIGDSGELMVKIMWFEDIHPTALPPSVIPTKDIIVLKKKENSDIKESITSGPKTNIDGVTDDLVSHYKKMPDLKAADDIVYSLAKKTLSGHSANLETKKQFYLTLSNKIMQLADSFEDEDKKNQLISYSKGYNSLANTGLNEEQLNEEQLSEMYNFSNNDFLDVLVGDADLDYMKSESPEILEFDLMEAIYVFRHDYNEDHPFLHYLNSLLQKDNFRPSPLINEYEDLEDAGKMIYDALVRGEEFYKEKYLDGAYEEALEEGIIDSLKAKIKGVNPEQTEYNKKNNLPADWKGTKEGYHEYITNKKHPKNTNEDFDYSSEEVRAQDKKEFEEEMDKEIYYVVDNDFNKAHYPDLVGKTFEAPPSYAQVKVVKQGDVELQQENYENEDVWDETTPGIKFLQYNGMQIMNAMDAFYVGDDGEFETLEQAKDFIDNYKGPSDREINLYRHSAMEESKEETNWIVNDKNEIDIDMPEKKNKTFHYYINIDERGEFNADVRDENDNTVFEITEDDFEMGIMKHKHDHLNLKRHLIRLGILSSGDTLVCDETGEILEGDGLSLANKHGENAKPESIDETINESYGDRYEQIVFMQGQDADHALNILKQDGRDDAMEYLKQWHYPGEHDGSKDIGNGTMDKTYEKDGYIMSWNAPIGYIGLVYDTDSISPYFVNKKNSLSNQPTPMDEDSQMRRKLAGQRGKTTPLGQHAPHSQNAKK